jgi:protein SCO1/2
MRFIIKDSIKQYHITLAIFSITLSLSPFTLNGLAFALPQNETNQLAQRAGIIEKLGNYISLDSTFTDDEGNTKDLSKRLKENLPTIIAPVYFECPRLCTLTQEGLLKAINQSSLTLGVDFQVLSVSFNHKETSIQAKERADVYHESIEEKEGLKASEWKFLVGEQNQVETLMKEIGFNYEYDQGEYMHAAGLIVIGPNGLISRYLYGIEFPKRDFELAIIEASEGKVGSFIDRALMFCFRYDHIQGQYTLAIWNIIRIVSVAFAIIMAGVLVLMRVKELRKMKKDL